MNETPYASVVQILNEIKKCDDAGATTAAVALTYIGIDVMAGLSIETDRSVTRRDFISWVDRYLRADEKSAYQYVGKDVYAARCGLLHAYGAEADLHKTDPAIRYFGYHDGGQHRFVPDAPEKLVLIGVKSLIHDFSKAVETFLTELGQDSEATRGIEKRLTKLFQSFPLANRSPRVVL
jgi:hypothetical protein